MQLIRTRYKSLTVDLLHTKSEAAHAVEDLVRGLDPFERGTNEASVGVK